MHTIFPFSRGITLLVRTLLSQNVLSYKCSDNKVSCFETSKLQVEHILSYKSENQMHV